MFRMIYYFRQAQRSRTLEEWPKYEEEFFIKLEALCMNQTDEKGSEDEDSETDSSENPRLGKGKGMQLTGETKQKLFIWLRDYFIKEWFCERWLCKSSPSGV